MRLYKITITILLIMLLFAISSYANAAVKAIDPHFQFTPVLEGTIITHDFVIENTGTKPLHISKVKTSCGCTTADYTKVIEAKGRGKISIKGNTTGYGGRSFKKTISVSTDDPEQSSLNLFIAGEVERFATIDPRRVFLNGSPGSELESIITIVPEEKYPFAITGSYTENLDDKIKYTLEQKNGNYVLTVKNLLATKGQYWGKIRLKTDNPVHSEIIIPVVVVIKEKKA